MTPQKRANQIHAVRECLRYVQRDADKINLMLVSLHIQEAIAEANAVLDELAAKFGVNGISPDMDGEDASGEPATQTE